MCNLFLAFFPNVRNARHLCACCIKVGINMSRICLMTLQQVFPNLADDLNSLSKLSLENFKFNSQIESYLDAVIKSGIAADVDQGIVFLLGNTGVGKTSLTHTLKDFIEKPTDNPNSILAGIGKYKSLLETQVLEAYEDVPFRANQKHSVKLTPSDGGPTLVDILDKENSAQPPELQDEKGNRRPRKN